MVKGKSGPIGWLSWASESSHPGSLGLDEPRNEAHPHGVHFRLEAVVTAGGKRGPDSMPHRHASISSCCRLLPGSRRIRRMSVAD